MSRVRFPASVLPGAPSPAPGGAANSRPSRAGDPDLPGSRHCHRSSPPRCCTGIPTLPQNCAVGLPPGRARVRRRADPSSARSGNRLRDGLHPGRGRLVWHWCRPQAGCSATPGFGSNRFAARRRWLARTSRKARGTRRGRQALAIEFRAPRRLAARPVRPPAAGPDHAELRHNFRSDLRST